MQVGRDVGADGAQDAAGSAGEAEGRHRHDRAAEAASDLRQEHDAVAGHVEGARPVLADRLDEDRQEVLDVHELQARVVPERRRQGGAAEVLAERREVVDIEQVGGAQGRDQDLGSAPREPARVRLDLDDVLRESRADSAPGARGLAEQRRVARRGAVDGGRGAQHELAHDGRTLARGQQLHRADDVELLAATATPHLGAEVEVHHGVDVLDRDDLADDRRADVGADELDAAEVTVGKHGVDTDDLLDRGLVGEAPRHEGGEGVGDAGDQNDLAHGAWGLLAQTTTLHARALQHLAVLLLRHPLATLLDDRTHRGTPVLVLVEMTAQPTRLVQTCAHRQQRWDSGWDGWAARRGPR